MADYSYMAFLDILGYKQLLDTDTRNGNQTFKDKMISSFKVFDEVNSAKFSRRVISDSIFITCAEREAIKDLLALLSAVFCKFLGEGLLIRGDLSYGEQFQNETITYSPVLTKAYLLESKTALFPRIMVDRNIHEMFPNLCDEGLLLASGEQLFINVLSPETAVDSYLKASELFHSQKDQIESSEDVRSKHKWLQDYIIQHCGHANVMTDAIVPYIKTFDVASGTGAAALVTPSEPLVEISEIAH